MVANNYFGNIIGGTSAIKKMLWYSSEQFHDNTEKLIGGKSIQGIIAPDLSYQDLTIYDDHALLSLLYYAGSQQPILSLILNQMDSKGCASLTKK